ncbi:uncharacterized protein EV422DRAFT_36294 [Fimicolochytrium jonesii]|uniref:uncharacterized protein n=1 Tax=Fimicolochytrium jonesii TaxID=1396493 RepID=UPI0022FF19F2|nr:uncharacterized protein EV422DRAFT_36294 [Fimicolochytrium jonesii]KAI8821288.1 hypothetical protein EV422DRAFT_36294 [Fimicolochytrium jonesii]
MVSFYLLHRGLTYFTTSGANFLPLLKHAMDLYFAKRYASVPCAQPWFRYTCFDDFSTDWSFRTELGCVSIIALLTVLILGFHTLLATYHFMCCWTARKGDFLAGTEFGCCGAAAVVIGLAADDEEVSRVVPTKVKHRRMTRVVTAVLEVPLIAAACVAINIDTSDTVTDSHRSSLWLLLVVLMLNLSSFIDNIYEGLMMFVMV